MPQGANGANGNGNKQGAHGKHGMPGTGGGAGGNTRYVYSSDFYRTKGGSGVIIFKYEK